MNLTTVTSPPLIRFSGMKYMSTLLVVLCLALTSYPQTKQSQNKQTFITTDLNHYWAAYDQIVQTKDSAKQIKLIQDLYINKASEGLKQMMLARGYTAAEYIQQINAYPLFWQSLRKNTTQLNQYYPAINQGIAQLKKAYPSLTPASIYFSIGAFRTGGMIHENKLLIGCEFSAADKTTITKELPNALQTFYQLQNPLKELALLCTHEYIHTQQKPLVNNLLSSCLYEGIAEFISCKVTEQPSTTPAIAFGKDNQAKVVEQFVKDLFNFTNDDNWLWGRNNNHLKVRDLGYYIGYEIAERYYNERQNKTAAIKTLIELDYTNEKEVERIVDQSNLLPASLEKLYESYDQQRPTIINMSPFKNGSTNVESGLRTITVYFSEPMITYNTGVDNGPLGDQYFPKMLPNRSFSTDGLSWTFTVDLKPNQRYQILISNNFRKADGVRLKPYLIDFKTAPHASASQ